MSQFTLMDSKGNRVGGTLQKHFQSPYFLCFLPEADLQPDTTYTARFHAEGLGAEQTWWFRTISASPAPVLPMTHDGRSDGAM